MTRIATMRGRSRADVAQKLVRLTGYGGEVLAFVRLVPPNRLDAFVRGPWSCWYASVPDNDASLGAWLQEWSVLLCLKEDLMAESESDHPLYALREQLRGQGYEARIVNLDCFDIDQNGRTHYLSLSEARALAAATAQHGVLVLMDYAEWRGLNWWYTFPEV